MLKKVLGAAAAVGLMIGAANAATVNVTYVTGSPFGNEDLSQGASVNGTRTRVGEFQLQGDSGFGRFAAFCVDVVQGLASRTTYTVNPTLYTGAVLDQIDRLFTSAYATVDTAVEAAAFQIALWEVIGDNGNYDLSSGSFFASSNYSVMTQANAYLDGLATASKGGYKLTFLSHPSKQDIVIGDPIPTPSVPLPASGLLLISGLGGVAVARRRNKRS